MSSDRISMHTRQANMLAEIDSLDIHVIVNDELDPISPSPNAAVKVASRFMGIPLSPLSSERGGATMEMRMDNICCAAHGISLLLVGFLFFSHFLRLLWLCGGLTNI